ncbi:MAG: hypothetical protein WBF33_36425 [Candidatus Nitrosopolaris sp.]|jgi:hypothetical protein
MASMYNQYDKNKMDGLYGQYSNNDPMGAIFVELEGCPDTKRKT